ncbi:DUF1415 domain-containing protein [Paraneptunicella aestuarii]|uniref:DUF1415 domain-containing protein n=1 Tax=Paraneptunicella aestuarii TaxID=2831148 RepID=UPI001E2911D1|nr:DUF1415 domain-containing protein [Paraneptunicella aestuarii]UAA38439.1 DUF1415 domain-containing protein [Paraneptunicella aestuarii]
MDHRDIAIAQTQQWVSNVIVDLNLCPFAGREVLNNTIRYQAYRGMDFVSLLEALKDEFYFLDTHKETATSLIIYPEELGQFDDYLDFVDLANDVLHACGYEGVYQLATFHPEYSFEGTEANDVENYTNRAPHPMLHIIREDDLEKALAGYTNPESIPERNIKLMNKLGLTHMKQLLQQCVQCQKK